MTFNDLLTKAGFDLATTMVLRHRPTEPQLRKVLPWLAAERPAIFNAYQQGQSERVEKAIQSAKHVAAFIGSEAGKATFVGLYQLAGWKAMPVVQCWKLPAMRELFKHGLTQNPEGPKRESVLWFDLQPFDWRSDWKGKLVIHWPGKELSWWRWADRNTFDVHAIREESEFDSEPPSWDRLILKWHELSVLPSRLKAKVQEWRGIYFIFDTASGRGYVGSACGQENILGRWLNYAASGHGGNKHLKTCDRTSLVFSILQRLSPDTPVEEVVRVENTWKERLHTRHPSGLNDN